MGSLWALALLLWLQTPDFQAQGIKALEEQRYADAVEAFQKAAAADPKDYGAHFHLALAHSLLGNDVEAIPVYQKTLELKPGLYEAELNLGIVLLRQKRAREAIAPLRSAVEKKPSEFRPVFYLAEALAAAGDAAEAEKSFRAASGIDPKSTAAHLGLGRALIKLGRLPEAVTALRRAAELDAEFRDAPLEVAALYEERKQIPEAIAIYEQFAEKPEVRERLGELLLQNGRAAEAIAHLEAAVEKSPTAANQYALAMAYLKNKEPDKAVPILTKAVDAEPGNFDLRMTLGRTLRDRKQYPAAAAQFLNAAKAKPDSREAWSELAGMLILIENYPQALAALDRLQAMGEEGAAVHYFRAIVLDRSKQYKPALESYQKFLALSEGKNPDEEFKARQRIRVIEKELSRR